MFGIGWSETLIILAVAVLVIGPDDLPRVLHAAGKTLRKIKKFGSDIQASLDEILHEEELNDIIRDANKAGEGQIDFEIERQEAREKIKEKYKEEDLND